jgi:hypothetical protein
MKLSTKKIITMSGFAMIVMSVVLIAAETYGEDKITMQRLSGIWWTYDANDVPWAIQFNEDGTFRIAHTVLRLDNLPKDEGKFQLEGESLILISDKDCEGSCKGLEGNYKVEFTKYDKLLLKEQDDQCSERKEVCRAPWGRVLK